jgi:ribosomal protein S18 acetylase RimI-like enzyme
VRDTRVGEIIRYIQKHELRELLDLYKHLNKDDLTIAENDELRLLWEEILEDKWQHYMVAEVDGKLVSSCVMVVIKNLTRSAHPYALIENVVTHPDYRNKGIGTRLLKRAQEIAKEKGCYKVMLLTGRKNAISFYEDAGFERRSKTGFIIRFDGR